MTNPARPMVPLPIHATCSPSEPAPASAVLSRTGSHKAAGTSRSPLPSCMRAPARPGSAPKKAWARPAREVTGLRRSVRRSI